MFCLLGRRLYGLSAPPPAQRGECDRVLADVLSKSATFRPLKNSLYVKTRLLGLKVHMESGGIAPGEKVRGDSFKSFSWRYLSVCRHIRWLLVLHAQTLMFSFAKAYLCIRITSVHRSMCLACCMSLESGGSFLYLV